MNKGGSLMRLAAVALAGVLAAGCAGVGPVAAPSTDVAAAAAPAERSFERGKQYLVQGKTGLAVEAFRLALDADPQSVRALNGLAASYDRLRRFDLADRYYRRALAIEPRSAQTLNNLGYSYLLRSSGAGDLALARQYLEQARALDTGNTVVAANLARLNDLAPPPAAAKATTLAGLGAGVSVVEPGAAWIERASVVEQHLVTAPDAEIAALARRLDLAPQVAAVSPTFGCADARDCTTGWRSGAVADRLPRFDPATRSAAESSAAGCADALGCGARNEFAAAARARSIDYRRQLASVRPAADCADALDCMALLRSDAVAIQPPRLDPPAQVTDESAAAACTDAIECAVANGIDSVTDHWRDVEHGFELAAVPPAAGCADAVGCLMQLRSGAVAASAEPPIGLGALTPT